LKGKGVAEKKGKRGKTKGRASLETFRRKRTRGTRKRVNNWGQVKSKPKVEKEERASLEES